MNTPQQPHLEALLAEQSWLHSLAQQLVRDPNAALDLEQETWLAAIKAPPTRPGNLRGWLAVVAKRIARRKHFSELARKDRQEQVSRPDQTPSTADAVDRAECIKTLVEATLSLDSPFREVVLLRYFDDMSPREVALELGVPASTVRSRLTRAHEKLREQLTGVVEQGDARPGILAALIDAGYDLANRCVSLSAMQVSAIGVVLAGAMFALTSLLVDEYGESQQVAKPGSAETMYAGLGSGASQLTTAQHSAQRSVALLNMQAPLTGTLLAPDGTPIADAVIQIEAHGSHPNHQHSSFITAEDVAPTQVHDSHAPEDAVAKNSPESGELELRSDANGKFEVPRQYMSDSDDGHGHTGFMLVFQEPGFTTVTHPLLIGARIELRPLWSVTYSGVVRDALSAQPVEAVEITYGPDKQTTVSDALGRFHFDDIPSYQGHPTTLFHPNYVFQERVTPLVGPAPSELEFLLDPGTPLEIIFVDAHTGDVLPGAKLTFDIKGKAGCEADESGTLRVRLPKQGHQTFRGGLAGYANYEWNLPMADVPASGIVQVRLYPFEYVHGQLIDEQGLPVEGARVSSWPQEEHPAQRAGELPGVIRHALISVGTRTTYLNTMKSDSDGRFKLAVLAEQGPWRVLARKGSSHELEHRFYSVEDQLTLVLPSPSKNSAITVKGQLMRDGSPWTGRAWLELSGPSKRYNYGGKDGRFAMGVHETGAYQLTWGGSPLRGIGLHTPGAEVDLGQIDLSSQPSLHLRFLDSDGQPLARESVRIAALNPAPLANTERQGVPVSSVRAETNSTGWTKAVLPQEGMYQVSIGMETTLYHGTIAVSGNTTRTIQVKPARTIYLRLQDAESGQPLGMLRGERFMTGYRLPFEQEVGVSEAYTGSDGLLKVTLPHGATELSLRPDFGGYEHQVLPMSDLRSNSQQDPTNVHLKAGTPVAIHFDSNTLADFPRGAQMYLIESADLNLVRPPSSRAERIDLAARGRDVYFIDPRLAMFQLPLPKDEAPLSLDRLPSGIYSVVAFDGDGQRMKHLFVPEQFELSPDSPAVHLRLRR